MANKKYKKEFTVLISFIILILVTLILDFINNSGGKMLRIALIFITIIGFYLFYNKTFLKGYKTVYYIVMGFIFASMYLASIYNFYSIPYYDKVLHLFSGFLISIIGYILFLELFKQKSRNVINKYADVVFVSLFSTAMAAVWEIWEFSTDLIFGLSAQNGDLTDTMLDIISGTIVGIITALLIYRNYNKKKVKIIDKILNNKDQEDI